MGSPAAPAVSIVVPVYRTERTLAACLDSALAQTVSDIEVICVDDGSPDGSAKILADYARRDPRGRVVTKENGGLSSARNAGMDAARGDWIAFLDSDDEVLPVLSERVLAAAGAEPDADCVTFGAVCEPADAASARIKRLLSPRDAVYHGFDPVLLFSANAQPYAWRTVVSRDFARREKIRFDESLRFAEDVPFHFTVYPLARTTVLMSDRLYRYRMTEGSLTHTFNASSSRERKLEHHLQVLDSVFRSWDEHGLGALCPAEMVSWCVDFTLFDLMGVPPRASRSAARELAAMLGRVYGADWTELPRKAAVRAAARAIAEADGEGVALGRLGVMRTFVATRGIVQCVQRALRRD